MSAAAPPDRSAGHAYRGALVVFGTRHGKEQQAAPAFRHRLGADVVAPPDLDTDQFGTFTGETPRRLTPLAAARAKAELAATVTGARHALASEASYGPLPGVGLAGHEELLLFLDLDRGWEIVEGTRTLEVPGLGRTVRSAGDLDEHLLGLMDAGQALIVRPEPGDGGPAPAGARKGITEPADLAAAVAAASGSSPTGRAVVEPDLRALHNPSRRRVLADLADRLARRLATPCPDCGSPGFGRTETLIGLPCAECGTPTEEPRADVHRCPACPGTRLRPRSVAAAEPRCCPRCNP